MIPLVVCRAYSSQDLLWALVIVGAVVILGAVAARSAKPAWIWVIGVVGILLPSSALFGFWPFDPKWVQDCGATPDPSLLTMGAALLSPLLLGVAFFASKRIKRLRP